MKKYISLILLIIILFVSNGYYLYFKYLQNNIQYEIKQEVKKGLCEKDFVVIVVSTENEKEIIWLKKNKEFRYKGFMYDIVKTKQLNNKKYYYCINDINEKNLIANYIRNNRRRSKKKIRLQKILSNKYFPEKFSINFKINQVDIYYSEYQYYYNSVYIETFSPPPKV